MGKKSYLPGNCLDFFFVEIRNFNFIPPCDPPPPPPPHLQVLIWFDVFGKREDYNPDKMFWPGRINSRWFSSYYAGQACLLRYSGCSPMYGNCRLHCNGHSTSLYDVTDYWGGWSDNVALKLGIWSIPIYYIEYVYFQ